MKSQQGTGVSTPDHGAEQPLTDPVCGMSVKADGAHRTAHESRTYVFCCKGCLEKFTASPAHYVSPGSGGAA